MNSKVILLSLLVLLMAIPTFAQTQEITGTVLNATTLKPIERVHVTVLNDKNTGGTTDKKGVFSIKLSAEHTVVLFSHMAYKEVTYNISELPKTIYLEEITNGIEEVLLESSSRTQKKRAELPIAISSISAQMMDNEKPNSIDQVINQIPGVNMVDLGNEQHMMSIRQPISTKSLFLYLQDGIPIRPMGVFNHNALLEMNMAATRQIEVIRGPYSSFYGSEAVGGAINFSTAQPSLDREASVSVRGNTIGYSRADANYSDTFGKTGVYVGGYYAQTKDGYRSYGDFDKTALTFALNHDFSPKLKWKNTFTYVNYYSDMSGSIGEEKFYAKDFSSDQTFTYRKVKSLRYHSKLEKIWNDDHQTHLTFIYRDNQIKQNPSYRIDGGTENDSYTNGQENTNRFNSYGYIIQHNAALFDQKLKWHLGNSLDFSPNTYKSLETDVYRNAQGKFASYTYSGLTLANYSADILNSGSYFAVSFRPIYELEFNGSVRWDYISYDFTNRIDNASDYKAPNSKETFTALTKRLGVMFRPNEFIGAYTNVSDGFIPPSIGELFRRSDVPLLNPSKFKNAEVGIWINLLNKKLYIELGAYYLEGKDEVVSVTVIQEGKKVRENRNVGKTNHRGFEYELRYQLMPTLSLRTSGAISEHRYQSFVTTIVEKENKTDFSGNLMPLAPVWVSNTELAYKPSFLKGLRTALEWQHISKYYTDDANTTEYGGYDVFNLRVNYRFSNWEVWGQAMNLFDKLYSTRTSTGWGRTTFTPAAPLHVNLGVQYNF